jgi:prepilin signal peptidase PulO-like enzyme (type II secretory pathway)
VAVIDLEYRLVLNRMLLAALPLLLLAQQLFGELSFGAALLGGVIGFSLFLLLALIRPGSMGMGDVKLAGVIGVAVGLPDLYLALLVGVLAGGLMGLFILIRSNFRPGQSVAYAPYLVLGAWSALFLRADLLHMLGRITQ